MNVSRKITNTALLARCLVYAVCHGRADKVPKSISKIIVAPDGKLGDVVCATPVLAAIRNNFPKAYITVCGNSPLHKSLLADSGLVDGYLDFRDSGNSIKLIEKCHADIALVTGPSYESTALFYLAGIPMIIAPKVHGGFSPYETRPYKILQRFIKTFPYRMGEYAPRERLRALEPIGITAYDTSKHLGFSKIADEKIKQFFINSGINSQEDFIIGISPSAGNKIKEWPEKRFAEVADHLATDHNAKVIIIGGPEDREKVERTIGHMKTETTAIQAIDFNLDELKSLVSKLSLFISVDTGPIYIAEAFGVPTIDITGPIDEREQPPRGLLHRNVVPQTRLRPELFVMNARSYNKKEALRQVGSISVNQVIEEIENLLAILAKKA